MDRDDRGWARRRRVAAAAAVAVFAFLAAAASASATTLTFTGAVDSNWNTSGNWSGGSAGQVPDSTTDAVINTGSVQVTGSDANARSLALDTGASPSGSLSIVDHKLTVSSSGTSTISGFIAVSGTLNLNDPTTYTGSVNSGGINVAGTMNIGSSFTMTGDNSTNNATINDTSASATSLLHVLGTGSLVRNTSTGTQTIGPRVDNDGTASVQTGTLNLNEGDAGSTTGSYAVSSGATLQVFAGGGQNTFESPSITGAGTVAISGTDMTIGATDTFTVPTLHIDGLATLTLNKSLSIPTLVSTAGHRNGTGTLTVTGTADFSDLQLDTGTTTVAASVGSFAITKFLTVGSTVSGTNSTLNLDAPTTYAASADSNGINLGGGILNIASTFTMSGAGIDSAINNTGGSPVVHVLGTGSLTRNTSLATVGIGAEVDNDGTVTVQTGTLDLPGAGLIQAAGLTDVLASAQLDGSVALNGGTLKGTGTLGGPVTNTAGTVAPGESPGTLTITGNYTQGAAGTLAEEITGTTPGSQFDRLVVGGTVTLDGTLAIQSQSFAPAGSDTFKIISGASSRTGTFAQLTGATVNSATYSPQYDTDGVTLTVTAGSPPPSNPPSNTAAPSISGTPAPGQTLTCSTGTWTNNPTSFAYQWSRDGTPIPGATSQTYAVGAADQGHALTCAVTASNAGGPGSPATSAAVNVPAPASPAAPVNTSAPAISGTPLPDHRLTCASGGWTNSPTSFTYQWSRNGTPIAGATSSQYSVQISDEALSLTCTVTASNAAGPGSPQTSGGVLVAVKGTLNCPKPTGRLSGGALGPLSLGMTRANARRKLHRFAVTHNKLDNFCLFAGWGIRVGYPSSRMLGSLSPRTRGRVAGKIVIALTANPFYALSGVRPGMRLSAVASRLKVGKVFHIGLNLWYLAPGTASNGVLKVRGGVIQEVGIADKRLTHGRKTQARFLASFR